ncbi:MAG: Holliday junction resolvase RuvX [Anaerolineae bacterium]|nr:Holliday junction resolvase RuvX [Anaerolineae bacterium]
MGIDYGEARIGVALSDPLSIFAQPHSIIAHTKPGEEFPALSTIVEQNQVIRIVVGLPTDSMGGIGSQAKIVIRWARELANAVSLPITLWDESYSSEEALAIQRASGRRKARDNRRRKPLDDVAAAAILQDYLDAGGRDDEPGQTLETFTDIE